MKRRFSAAPLLGALTAWRKPPGGAARPPADAPEGAPADAQPQGGAEGGTGRGMAFVLLAFMVFGVQDGVTKHLVQTIDIPQMLLVRFAALAVFVTWWTHRRSGLKRAIKSRRPWLQIFRSALLVAEIVVFATGIKYMPLAYMHAVFAVAPLIAAAMAVPLLGEYVGPHRWAAVGAGFVGVLIILRPGAGVMAPEAVLALISAFMFALYVVLTRMSGKTDSADTSALYLGWTAGAISTAAGLFYWTAPTPAEWAFLGLLAVTGIAGHILLIMALEAAPAAVLQPFHYTVLVWAVLIGFVFWGETPDAMTVLGAAVVVSGGLYTIHRERRRAAQPD